MTTSSSRSREIRLRARPQGMPTAENFALVEVTLMPPAPGEVQVKNRWMSVDPYMRGRMIDQVSYVPPFQLDQVLEGGAIGEVVQSEAEGFVPGDLVQSMFGWRESFNAPAAALQKLPALDLPPEAYLGAAGLTGLTAYVGLLKIAEVKAGDTVFVSAAAGAVGSIACQIAMIKGARVIGSAGGTDKVAFLREIGVDKVINYKAESNLTAALERAAPEGIDVYFDNVGGEHLDAALNCSKPFARFALCGMIADYNAAEPSRHSIMVAIGRSLRLQGFIVSNYFNLLPEFTAEMAGWVTGGQMRWKQTVDEGIERAPEAFLKLFNGLNTGKMLVKIA